MNKSIYLYSVILVIAFAAFAQAHPLGNFSINQYSRLEVGKSEVCIRQAVDMAEIPTLQETSAIDTDNDGKLSQAELNKFASTLTPNYLANMSLRLDGQSIPLRETMTSISLRQGGGGLQTLEIKWDFTASVPLDASIKRVDFQNNNYPERLGWREIVVNRIAGVEVFDSTAFGSGITDELKAYPDESLSSPLNERAASFYITRGSLPEGARALQNRDGHAASAVQKDMLAGLIDVPEITPVVALFGLLLAFGLGAMHALSPGHGKAVVGAYLVGSKGTPKHAAFLGLTVTITHTLGVFALGLLTIFAANFILPETIMPFLSFFSGLIVLYIGLTMFKTRLLSALGYSAEHSHDHSEHGHSHDHRHDEAHTHTHVGHRHSHAVPDSITWKSLLALGVSGGLLPCPSALVLMLSAINLNRIGYGLILTVAFSFGLAATLTIVGLVFLYGGRLFDGEKVSSYRLVKALPVFSAFVIACVGAIICYTSIT